MNQLLDRFMTPRMVATYYDRSILLSPLFLLLTALYVIITWQAIRILRHDARGLLTIALIVATWAHLIVQRYYSWFNSGDSAMLRKNAAKTTLAFSTVYAITVGMLLEFIH